MLKVCILAFALIAVYAHKDMALTEVADEISYLADQELTEAKKAGSTDQTVREQFDRIRPRMLFRLQRLSDIRMHANKSTANIYGPKYNQLFNSVMLYRSKYFLAKPSEAVTKQFAIEGLTRIKKVSTQIKNKSKRLL
ncbi:unnamed protein product [Auanema sp. JU1783]|nr:unnamed protein product [Auanema sp. JU1783]